jgi:ABC-type branched-subunit amino acid transport system ATPase component
MSAESANALDVRGVSRRFGALVVANDINLSLPVGARHALIGPNGAGKTTLVNMITGALRPDSGGIELFGQNITGRLPRFTAPLGLARTFQITNLFVRLSVWENLALAVATRTGADRRLFMRASRQYDVLDEVAALLEQVGLAAEATRPVGELPYGRQRLVELAMALALKPRVLLLDEPAAGVPSIETGQLLEVINGLPQAMAILMIDHDMDLVFRFARRITVLVGGSVLTEDTPDNIRRDPRVRDVYLGRAHP